MTKHPIILFIITNILAFGLIFFYLQPHDTYILIAGAVVLSMSLITYFCISHFRWGDRYLFIIASMLVVLGVAMLCRINYTIGVKQIVWYAIGIILFTISYMLYAHFHFWRNLQWTYFGASVILFILTLILGQRRGGATNWIIFGPISVQPSEIIKVLFAMFISCGFARQTEKRYHEIKEKYIINACVAIFCGFLILQREWGSTVVFYITYLIMLFIYSDGWGLISLNAAALCAMSALAVKFVAHIQTRVGNWLNPFADPSNLGYQTTQSLFAIATGGFFGTGLGLGHPVFIPEVHSDFIFSAICEEMGVLGGFAIILLFMVLVYRGYKICIIAQGYDKCVATCITTIFGIQTFIIIGGVVNFIPLTGITLPFISYGGSSLTTTFISLGLLQAISRNAQLKYYSPSSQATDDNASEVTP
ncbi:MAG: FtsW/RodA/SpoVE family cell cycle protein [Clostridiales bacterium]|jgi:cell division protein FtsW (lipid II flippase)|nr:FtsW/RodA/SpoVE family cell cycle protein [Clostridiales bacterium]